MTAEQIKPLVLHVDDEPEDLRTWEREVHEQGRISLEVCHPDDVTEEHLRCASLVLVDFKIKKWPGRDNVDILALKPCNGLALLAVLQEKAYELDRDRPRAFALYTALISDVARGLVAQPYIVARAHNLEWIYDKTTDDLCERARLVAELAETVNSLPRPWPGDSPSDATSALTKWLAIPTDASWKDSASRDVDRCYPPIHEFAEHTHGIGVLRWVLHRIWPYPTFLIDDAHLAARLRVDLGSLRKEICENEKMRDLMSPVQYNGPLADFIGRKWWRAGIESIIFELASDDPASIEELHKALNAIAPELKILNARLLFPVLDENFRVRDELATSEEVVEIKPDDWPPFADAAWALRSDTQKYGVLRAIAVQIDSQWELNDE